jgi:DNA-directed RNA polymerase specialized sigma24 family protein
MTAPSITSLLDAWKGGDRSVENALANSIYPMLRDLAASQIRRKRDAEKRGSDVVFVDLEDADKEALPDRSGGIDWLALDQALTKLALEDNDCARVVEMRIFSGLQVEEIATVMQSSTATVGRQWRFARNWLALNLGGDAAPAHG